MPSEKKKASNAKYDAANTVHKGFKFNKNTDADIIAAFEKQENLQAFVKAAIRAYIKKAGD